MRFDGGGDYYGRFDDNGRNPRPSAKYLLELDIKTYSIQCLVLFKEQEFQTYDSVNCLQLAY